MSEVEIVQPCGPLDPASIEAVGRLVRQATAVDGLSPLNEAAQLNLTGGTDRARHWLVIDDHDTVGYAQLDVRDGYVQLVIAPDHRHQGLGRRLAEQVRQQAPTQSWWAFGNLPSAQGLAHRLGLTPIRGLHLMTRPVPLPADAAPEWPTGIRVRHFALADLDALVAVNAAAFAHHPEQGALTADDLRSRMAQDWFNPDDLLLATDQAGAIVGFHWMKITDRQGEVYVLGVAPEHSHRGIGRALLAAGILHMQRRGVQQAELYVEASESRVVRMYQRSGFTVRRTDMAYAHGEQR